MFANFGGNNQATRKKRVYYTETASTIYEGMPVCYDFDTTANVLGWDKENSQVGATTAEGYQNEGKYLHVEDPDAGNIEWFAGVVAAGSHCGQLGGRYIDIFVPNGAIVPVRTDLNCLIGQTILATTTGSQELGVPLATDSRPVAISMETRDRGTAGLVLAKLCPDQFMYQDHAGTALSVDDADTTTATLVNNVNVKFLGSATYNRVLYMIGELAGGGAGLNGMFKFRTYVNSTMTSLVQVVCANLHIKDAGVITTGGGEWNSAFYGTIETETTTTQPDLSGGKVAGIQLAYYVDETTGAPARAAVIAVPAGFGAGTYDWDCLLWTGFSHVGDSDHAGGAGKVVGFDGDTDIRKIPVYFGETVYYLLAGVGMAEVNSD